MRLAEAEEKIVLRYMQRTKLSKMILAYGELTLLVERKDGATNMYQEPGYHDYLDIEELLPAVRIDGVGLAR